MDVWTKVSIRAILVGALSGLVVMTPSFGSDAFTAEQVAKGKQAYDRTCVRCHGRNMVSAGTTTYDLRRFPSNDPDRFFESVYNGVGNMPSWRGRLEESDVQAIWAYVATRGGKEM